MNVGIAKVKFKVLPKKIHRVLIKKCKVMDIWNLLFPTEMMICARPEMILDPK